MPLSHVQVFKDVWADVEQPETAPKSKLPQVKLRLKIALGLPQKKPTKIPIQNVTLPKAIQRTKGTRGDSSSPGLHWGFE